MKTAICYYSRHHGNTLKLLEAMAGEGKADLIDVTTRQAVRLEGYDCIGFASGVYYGNFHKSVPLFARQYLPKGKTVFSSALTAAGWANAPGIWNLWLPSGAVLCWARLAAKGMTPSVRSKWWAVLPKGIRMKPTWKTGENFSGRFWRLPYITSLLLKQAYS